MIDKTRAMSRSRVNYQKRGRARKNAADKIPVETNILPAEMKILLFISAGGNDFRRREKANGKSVPTDKSRRKFPLSARLFWALFGHGFWSLGALLDVKLYVIISLGCVLR